MAITTTGQINPYKDVNLRILSEYIIPEGDPECLTVCARVCWEWNKRCEAYWAPLYEGLTVVDAKKQRTAVDDEPLFNPSIVSSCLKRLPKVDGGYVVLTICKEVDLNRLGGKLSQRINPRELMHYATDYCARTSATFETGKTYRVIISKNSVKSTEGEDYSTLFNFLKECRYEVPTLHEHTYLMACVKDCSFNIPGNPKLLITSTPHYEEYPSEVGYPIEKACTAFILGADSRITPTHFDDERSLETDLPSERGFAARLVLPDPGGPREPPFKARPRAKVPEEEDNCTIS